VRLGLAALIGGCAALALAGGAAFLVLRARPNDPLRPIAIALGGEKLSVPSAYLRPDSRQGGAMDALDMAALFPDFSPAGATGDVNAHTDLSERFARIVFVTAKPSDSSLDPADRPARLYQRFLDSTSWSHPGGLVARAFVDGSPFEGDELYYVAPEGREFAARCRRPDPERKTPNTCIYDFRLGDLDVEMRFSAGLLAEWASLKAGARGLIETARR
jgi:hypothetical protein